MGTKFKEINTLSFIGHIGCLGHAFVLDIHRARQTGRTADLVNSRVTE